MLESKRSLAEHAMLPPMSEGSFADGRQEISQKDR